MKLILSLSFFVMLLTLSSVSNKNSFSSTCDANLKIDSDSLILWQSNKKLTWGYFQGKPDSLSKHKAFTNTSLKYTPIVNGKDEIEYNIGCYFILNLSWSKNKNNYALLLHEQLHFDIAELSARKFREMVLSLKLKDSKLISDSIKKIFNDVLNIRKSTNTLYDVETNHGTIEKAQKEWEAKIAKEIKALDKYSSTKVVVKRKF